MLDRGWGMKKGCDRRTGLARIITTARMCLSRAVYFFPVPFFFSTSAFPQREHTRAHTKSPSFFPVQNSASALGLIIRFGWPGVWTFSWDNACSVCSFCWDLPIPPYDMHCGGHTPPNRSAPLLTSVVLALLHREKPRGKKGRGGGLRSVLPLYSTCFVRSRLCSDYREA